MSSDLPDVDYGLRVFETLNLERDRLLAQLRQVDEDRDRAKGVVTRPPKVLSLEDIIARQAQLGPAISTGVNAIDNALRGGARRGKILTFNGKPGAGKTTLATQIGLSMSSTCNVGFVFADEGIGTSCVRIAQQLGVGREEAEKGEDLAVRQVANAAFKLNLSIANTDDPRMRILGPVVEDLLRAEKDPNAAHVWVLDSAQTLLGREGDEEQERTERVIRFMDELTRLVQRHEAVAILTSQVNRASYRSKKDADNIDPLASGADSARIEFLSDCLFWVGSTRNLTGTEQFSLLAAKNRIGGVSGHICGLTLDRARARFYQVDGAADAIVGELPEDIMYKEVRQRIIDLMRAEPYVSAKAMVEAVGARRALVERARTELLAEKLIFFEEYAGKIRWYGARTVPSQ